MIATVIGTMTASATTTATAATPGTAPAAQTRGKKTRPVITSFIGQKLMTYSDRDSKDDREDRDRRDNGANGEDRKRK